MRKYLLLLLLTMAVGVVKAQDEEEVKEKGGFKKENLFTGGSLSLSFFNSYFLVGASPVFGYKIADWIDAGVIVNFQYSSQRDYSLIDDRLRQTLYGGGVFTRIYPVNFLFVQAQGEHNFITQKYLYPSNGGSIKSTIDANSLLLGAGYSQGRIKGFNNGFFYIAVLFDVSKSKNSPYTDGLGRSLPIIRGGINVPLFGGGGGGGRYGDDY